MADEKVFVLYRKHVPNPNYHYGTQTAAGLQPLCGTKLGESSTGFEGVASDVTCARCLRAMPTPVKKRGRKPKGA